MEGFVNVSRIPVHMARKRLDILGNVNQVVIFEAGVFIAKHAHHFANKLTEQRFGKAPSSQRNLLTGKSSNQPVIKKRGNEE
jgi:hypothetical protein